MTQNNAIKNVNTLDSVFVGDATGFEYAVTVEKIQSYAISSSISPQDGYALTWSDGYNYWRPISIEGYNLPIKTFIPPAQPANFYYDVEPTDVYLICKNSALGVGSGGLIITLPTTAYASSNVGRILYINNTSATNINIRPNSGGGAGPITIDGSTTVFNPGVGIILICYDGNNWRSIGRGL